MKSARAFSLVTIFVTLGILGAFALLNYWIDPYNQYGNNRLGVYVTSDRESKATDVKRFKHNAILLGNSREGMIPPRKLDGFCFFNGAFGGGTAEEVYYFIEHFVFDQKVVILGIDYGQGDPPHPQGDLYAPKHFSHYISELLSLKTTENSFKTITDRLAGKKPSLERDGTFNAEGWFQKYDVEIPNRANLQIEDMKRALDTYENARPTSLTYYKKIAVILKERNIPCVIYIPPLPAPVAAHLPACGGSSNFANWERDMSSIFSNTVNLARASSGEIQNFFRSDLEHLTPNASARIVNQEVIPVCKDVTTKNP